MVRPTIAVLVCSLIAPAFPHAQLEVTGRAGAPTRLQHSCLLPTGALRWSDPDTWGGAVPAAGQDVTVPAGTTVLLDVSPPPLRTLEVDGRLVFGCSDLTLTADVIEILGELRIGSAAQPSPHRSIIQLEESFFPPGDPQARSLELLGGRLELHGTPRTSWVQLGANAPAGATTLSLASPVDWKPGERIVLASTDFDLEQAEERTIDWVAPDGTQVGLTAPLDFLHWGQVETLGVDERGEVALLDRNIVVRGASNAATTGLGGSMRFIGPGSAQVHLGWVEVVGLGDTGQLGRYPVHFHQLGDQTGSWVQGLSVHDGFNRSIVLHGTDNVLVEDCVSYAALGHAFYLEDGSETGNVLVDNLALSTRRPPAGLEILPSDTTPSGFWIMNFDNVISGNHAAGQQGSGFWFDLSVQGSQDVPPTFVGNVAHSSGDHGFYKEDYDSAVSGAITPVFDGFTAYKNRQRGIYWRSVDLLTTWRDARVADNATGLFLASDGLQKDGQSLTVVVDSVVVGETANVGTPVSPGELELGRSVPNPNNAEAAILGNTVYEGTVEIRDTTFANFVEASVGGAPRRAAAFGQTWFANPWAMDPRNRVSGITLVNAQAAFLKPNIFAAIGWANLTLWDQDGSLTGTPDSFLTADTSLLEPASGTVHVPAWNANVVPGPGAGNSYANFRLIDNTNLGIPALQFLSLGRGSTYMVSPTSNATTFAMNLLLPDDYQIDFSGPQATRSFRIELRFGMPQAATIVSVPYASPAPVAVKSVGTGPLLQSANLADLQAKNDQGWWYDAAGQRLYLKAILKGSGSTILDGQQVALVVDPD